MIENGNKIDELVEAIRPIVEQNPPIRFRGHAEDYVEIQAIPISQYTRLREAFKDYHN